VSLLNDKHTVCTGLVKALRDASVFNPEVHVAPACIIWPDRDRQWEAIVPRLQNELPELLVLGDYKPEIRIGPAIWLRCVIAGKVDDVNLPANKPPIFYLPGVSRQDLRAVENCPDHLITLGGTSVSRRDLVTDKCQGLDHPRFPQIGSRRLGRVPGTPYLIIDKPHRI